MTRKFRTRVRIEAEIRVVKNKGRYLYQRNEHNSAQFYEMDKFLEFQMKFM